jgi:hypothetical protein
MAQAMLADKRLSKGDVSVGMALLDMVRAEEGCAYPGFDYLARRVDLDRRSIIRSTNKLEAAGYFTIERSPGGRQNSNRYHPRWCTGGDDHERGSHSDSETVTAVSPLSEKTDTVPEKTMTAVSPLGGAEAQETVAALSPLPPEEPPGGAETVTAVSVNGDTAMPETVTGMSPEPSYKLFKTQLGACEAGAPPPHRHRKDRSKLKRPDPRQPEMFLPINGGKQALTGVKAEPDRSMMQMGDMVALLGKAGLSHEDAVSALMRLDGAGYQVLAGQCSGKAPETALRKLAKALGAIGGQRRAA